MRNLCILAVLCIVGYCDAVPIDEQIDPAIIACAEQLNFDLDVLNGLVTAIAVDESFEAPEELYCFVSCVRNKRMEREGTKTTIHEDWLMAIRDRAHEKYIMEKVYNGLYTREDLENILNKCQSKGLNDCDYLKCIKMFEKPFIYFLKH